MAFIPPKFEEIRDSILRDISSLNPSADVAIDSDYYIRASAIAAAMEGQYSHQAWIVRQIFADTADTDFLELHAAELDIFRKNATFSKGFVRIYGELDSAIKQGLTVKNGDIEYQTIEDGIISDQLFADIAVISVKSGVIANIEKETEAILTAAPRGCRTECLLLNALGGTDIETDRSLLERYLERKRRPPAGGNKHDFRNWALEVDGVTSAFVYPLRRGLGTVDIAITSGDRLPSAELVQKVQEHIDNKRPVTAKESLVISPTPYFIDFKIKVLLQAITLNDAEREISSVLNDYFLRLAPASPFILSQVEALISDIVGVVDREIVTPVANLNADIKEGEGITWFRLGKLEIEAF